MKPRLNMDKIAKGLRADRGEKMSAGGGCFGAMQIAGEVAARFRVPKGGGRATDPTWTEQRLVRLAPETLRRLEELSERLSTEVPVRVTPLQLAALLIEKASERISERDIADFLRTSAARK